METIKDRVLEKFIMTEFVSNRMNTQEQVSELIKVIATKRGTTKAEAGEFIKKINWDYLTLNIWRSEMAAVYLQHQIKN